jgi:hypothetical protein
VTNIISFSTWRDALEARAWEKLQNETAAYEAASDALHQRCLAGAGLATDVEVEAILRGMTCEGPGVVDTAIAGGCQSILLTDHWIVGSAVHW